MKEFKYIIHAFLLLLASSVVFICLKTLFSSQITAPVRELVLINYKSVPDPPSKGQLLFKAKCASCHILGKNFTGPSLCGFEERGPWVERENIYQWIKNPIEFMKKNEYAKDLRETYNGVLMQAFPNLTNEEIEEIIKYINSFCNTPLPAPSQQVVAKK